MTIDKIPYGRHYIDEDDVSSVVDVLRNSMLTQGPKVEAFERAVAEYVGAKYAVAVSSGTAALHLACLSANIGIGDNVVTSPNTFVASANCALYVGATPQFADIDSQTLNLDPVALEEKCKKLGRVKAIIPVHFAGFPCDMPAIKKIADHFGAVVIEDASHALGARYPNGGRVGNCSYSELTVFSFHPVKIIAAGEGGMITTNNKSLYRKLLRLRSHGINKFDDPLLHDDEAHTDNEKNPWYYEMQELGFNYRITDIQCALGISQMRKIDRFLARRLDIAAEYDKVLMGWENLQLTQLGGRHLSANHLYVIRIDFERIGQSRRLFMNDLLARGIGTQVHYIPVSYHPYFRKLGFNKGEFPVTEKYYQQGLSIPIFFSLTQEMQAKVINVLSEALHHSLGT